MQRASTAGRLDEGKTRLTHLTLEEEATERAAANVLQQRARRDHFVQT